MKYGTLERKQRLESVATHIQAGSAVIGLALLPALQYFSPGALRSTVVAPYLPAFKVVLVLLWLVGCGVRAKSKGYWAILGLVGIFGPLGALILEGLADRWGQTLGENPHRRGARSWISPR